MSYFKSVVSYLMLVFAALVVFSCSDDKMSVA